jgi:hypothetical protein
MLQTAVFLLSLSSISYEVLLTRVFSISQWNHLSFMVISIALFGFAASGTLLSILEARDKDLLKRLVSSNMLVWLIFLYTVSGATAFILLNRMPLDYFRLPLEPIQAFYLLSAYLLLAMPFFFTGMVISLAYIFMHQKTGYVYFATMAGSACGAIMPVVLLPLLGEASSVVLTVLVPMVLTPVAALKSISTPTAARPRIIFKRLVPMTACAGIVMAGITLMFEESGLQPPVKPSPYKSMSQILQLPNSRVTETVQTIRGKIDKVKTPYIRFAPGLSLKFKEQLPEQSAAFKDGDSQTVFYRLTSGKSANFARFTLPYLGYDLSQHPDRILIIHDSGGTAVPCAIASGAQDITVIEQHPAIARMITTQYPVTVVCDHPRAFLARTGQRFDIIQVESWGFSIPGTAALGQDFLFTKEGLSAYLEHLSHDGKLIFSRKLLLPPTDSLRLFGAAYEALGSAGVDRPERHLAVARNYDTFTVVVSINEIDRLRVERFTRSLNFDIVFLHDMKQDIVNRFNVFETPFHFIEIDNLKKAYQGGTQNDFFDKHMLDVAPRGDNRPFPSKFLNWTRLWDIYHVKGSRLYTLLMSGEVVVAVVFAEALLVSILLLVVPFIFTEKRRPAPPVCQVFYFLSVGVGFMLMEIYLIKSFTLLFGNPVISLTVVLSGILVFSGAGGIWSQRLGQTGIKFSLAATSVLLALMAFGLNETICYMLQLPINLRYVLAFLLLFPPGFLAGLPFPLGMRVLLNTPVERAYAWTSNGCGSVLSSIAAAQIAISLGIPVIAFFAATAYMLAFMCQGKASINK